MLVAGCVWMSVWEGLNTENGCLGFTGGGGSVSNVIYLILVSAPPEQHSDHTCSKEYNFVRNIKFFFPSSIRRCV